MSQLDAHRYLQGEAMFAEARQPGDLDLVDLIREAMIRAGLSERINGPAFEDHDLIRQAKNKRPHVQRWLLNRYWVHQFVWAGGDTRHVRLCLVGDGTDEEWAALFLDQVLPYVVANNLPRIGV